MADVFGYIVENGDAQTIIDLCHNYGFRCDTPDDAYSVLQNVANGSDQGFVDVMSLHPDKDMLVDLFSKPAKTPIPQKNCERLNSMLVQTNQADGGVSVMRQAAPEQFQFNSQNAMIAFGIVALIGIAIIIK